MIYRKIYIAMIILFVALQIRTIKAEELNADSLNVRHQPCFLVDIYAPVNFYFQRGEFDNSTQGGLWGCNPVDFTNTSIGSGITLGADILVGNLKSLPLFDSLTYGGTFRLSYLTKNFKGLGSETARKVNLNNQIVDLYEQNILDLKLSYVKLSFGFVLGSPLDSNLLPVALRTSPNLYFSVGPTISILANQKANQSVQIISPQDFNYLEGGNKKNLRTGEINDVNSLRFGFDILLGCDWYLSSIIRSVNLQNIIIGGEIGYSYDFTTIAASSTMNDQGILLRLGAKWLFR